MALLTNTQAQTLYSTAFERVKVYVDGTFYTIRVVSKLDGFEYSADNLRDTLGLTDVSTTAQIEAAVVAYFETLSYLGTRPISSQISF